MQVITKTELNLPFFKKGKIRDSYIIDKNLLIISTDRISAFDCVFNEGIPYKGNVLNKLSVFWFNKTQHIVENHFITDEMPEDFKFLEGRAMIVKKTQPILLEAVVRGYLTGSAWKEYKEKGSISGIELPSGLKDGSKLEEPIFTPATKADQGHDMNVSLGHTKELFGEQTMNFIKEKSIELYNFAHKYLLSCGLVLADTKFEFGRTGYKLILIDEALTPDSSRYWLKEQYDEGILENLDKQFLRDYLEKSKWNKEPPVPKLSSDIIRQTSERYLMAYKMITHKVLKV